MAVNLVLILERDLAKTGIRRTEMLNTPPCPKLRRATEGLCLYLAGQQEPVSAVMEPRGTGGRLGDGPQLNDTARGPRARLLSFLLCPPSLYFMTSSIT
ncbi:hypothetical protein EYF80_047467 [Liparis tanakae]|uniref:Uncharacterized protein n=1 Tax=Liparis tanakae TaxID=230148 RepID=A0A4Z2FPW5_9TELE|nr:hypothetical protein EYF80_047467 [Liparis tanakae]